MKNKSVRRGRRDGGESEDVTMRHCSPGKTILCTAWLSAGDGSRAECELRPEEAGGYRSFFVLSNADIPSRGIVV